MNEQYQSPNLSISETLERLQTPQPTVIALEGGPCGGKTTVVNRLADAAADAGRPVIVLPEAATEHIVKLQSAGLTIPYLATQDRPGFLAFEADVIGTIAGNIASARQEWSGTDALIVADRADIGAYLSREEYMVVLGAIGRDRPPHLDLVDKMIYLPSYARENALGYTALLATNTARYESPQEAIDTCGRNLAAIAMHPELSVHWGGDFEDKVRRVTREILSPETEVEAKFTLDTETVPYADAPSIVEGITDVRLAVHDITQRYHEWGGQEYRLRETVLEEGGRLYHYTVKTGSGSTRHELQRVIDADAYALLSQAPCYGELRKRRERYLFDIGDGRKTVLSADYYDDRRLCVLEVEGMTDVEAEQYDIPGFVRGGIPARELVQ